MSRTPKSVSVITNCLRGGCPDGHFNKANCKHCGFDVDEDERRKALPLVKGADGLRRKHIKRYPEKQESANE